METQEKGYFRHVGTGAYRRAGGVESSITPVGLGVISCLMDGNAQGQCEGGEEAKQVKEKGKSRQEGLNQAAGLPRW